jgi:hypothetical protein
VADLSIGGLCGYRLFHEAIPPKVSEIDRIFSCKLRDELVGDDTDETSGHSFSGIAPYPELIGRPIQNQWRSSNKRAFDLFH